MQEASGEVGCAGAGAVAALAAKVTGRSELRMADPEKHPVETSPDCPDPCALQRGKPTHWNQPVESSRGRQRPPQVTYLQVPFADWTFAVQHRNDLVNLFKTHEVERARAFGRVSHECQKADGALFKGAYHCAPTSKKGKSSIEMMAERLLKCWRENRGAREQGHPPWAPENPKAEFDGLEQWMLANLRGETKQVRP